jgi:AcrR family transcriptional regulator
MSAETVTVDADRRDKVDHPMGRPAAGEDPAKREQILDGADVVFIRMGFDAASMNDITREAGVSKGTLYVYFKNKEDLFAAIVQRQKLEIVGRLAEVLGRGLPVEETLRAFGNAFAMSLLSERTIRGARVLIGVAERMPTLCKTFFTTGANNGPTLLAQYIERQAQEGALKGIDEPIEIAKLFADMCMAGLFRQRIFGDISEPPSPDRVSRNVDRAVRVFLNTYGAQAG